MVKNFNYKEFTHTAFELKDYVDIEAIKEDFTNDIFRKNSSE
jgi:hypothetical protein